MDVITCICTWNFKWSKNLSVSAEASSPAGINSIHLTFSVLQATMLSLKKTQCCLQQPQVQQVLIQDIKQYRQKHLDNWNFQHLGALLNNSNFLHSSIEHFTLQCQSQTSGLTIPIPSITNISSISTEASSSAGINSTHVIFSVLQATMVSMKKIRSWIVSTEVSSSKL